MVDEFVALLSRVVADKQSIPLSISIKDDNEVIALKEEISALQSKIDSLKVTLNRTEYLYKCESFLNNRLVDLCRSNGITLGADFFVRPYEEEIKN